MTVSVPSVRSRPRARAGCLLALGLVLGVVVAAVAGTALSVSARLRVVREVAQPASVTYQDDITYHVVVVDRVPYGHPLVGQPHRLLVLGPDPKGRYGHPVVLGDPAADPRFFPMEVASVRWLPEEVVITFTSGHVVTVPAERFLHGR